MTDGLPPQVRDTQISPWRHAAAGVLTARRRARAAIVALFVLVLFLLVLEARLLSELPVYTAIVLVFVATIIVPGLILHQALLARVYGGLIERLLFALPFGLAIAAPAGLLALSLHLDLQAFSRFHTIFAALIAGASTLFFDERKDSAKASAREKFSWGAIPLVVLLAIAVTAIFTSPSWAGDRLSRDLDDWRFMSNVNSYMAGGGIDALEPVGIGEAPFARFASNVWLVVQASTADAAGATAEDVVLIYLTPLLTVLALAATYVLAKAWFRSRTVGLLAMAILLGQALMDVSPQEGIGRNLLLRMAEDKYVGMYILFPLGLLLISTISANRSPRVYVAFGLLAFAMFVVHPFPLMFLMITLAPFALLRALMARSIEPLRQAGYLLIPLVVFSLIGYLIFQLSQLSTDGPATFQVAWAFRENFRITRLGSLFGHGLLIGNYHLIAHPIVLAGLLLSPLAFLRSSRSIPNQLLFAAAVGWLPWFFFPPLATGLGVLASGTLLIRLPLIAPVAIILAYLLHEGILALQRYGRLLAPGRLRITRLAFPLAAPTFGLILVLGSGLLVQEAYINHASSGCQVTEPSPTKCFYQTTSAQTILPGTEVSIVLGGKDRITAGEWRPWDWQKRLYEFLRAELPSGSVVLAPHLENVFMPGLVQNVKPVHSHGVVGLPVQDPFVVAYYSGKLQGRELTEALEQRGVDYVVSPMPGRRLFGVTADPLPDVPGAELLAEVAPYRIYALR